MIQRFDASIPPCARRRDDEAKRLEADLRQVAAGAGLVLELRLEGGPAVGAAHLRKMGKMGKTEKKKEKKEKEKKTMCENTRQEHTTYTPSTGDT